MTDKFATTIRFDRFYGARKVRVWDVYKQRWNLYSLDERIPNRILASLTERERKRIRRAQEGEKS
jgi:hypothetical protein